MGSADTFQSPVVDGALPQNHSAPDELIIEAEASDLQLPLDDAYWLAHAKTLVESSGQKFNNAADSLEKLATWGLGLYTGTTTILTIGFTLAGRGLTTLAALGIAAGYAAFILVMWGTYWIRMPSHVIFHEDSPPEIRAAFAMGVRAKQIRLNITLLLSVIAAVLVANGILIASTAQPSSGAISFENSNFSGSITAFEGSRYLQVVGHAPNAATITIRVATTSDLLAVGGGGGGGGDTGFSDIADDMLTGVLPNATAEATAEATLTPEATPEADSVLPVLIYTGTFRTVNHGQLQASIPLPDEGSTFIVEMGWTDSTGTTRRVLHTISG